MASVLPLRVQAQTVGIGQESKEPVDQTLRLSPEAAQVADEIAVTLEMEKLKGGRTAESPMSLETLIVRQNITEKVLAPHLMSTA